jgi:hypothetical protein
MLSFVRGVCEAQVEKTITFTKAKPTVTLQGKLTRNFARYDAYSFRARKGQRISVKLATSEPDASFAIYEIKQELDPDEDQIVEQDVTKRVFSGVLPVTSEYAVQVYGKTSTTGGPTSGAPYTIEITLK